MTPHVLGFLGDEIREGGASEVGLGGHTMPRRGRGGARPVGWCGPLVAHLSLPFWLAPASDKIGTSGYFPIDKIANEKYFEYFKGSTRKFTWNGSKYHA